MKKGYRKFFDSIFILSIKRGLMLAIPFLILGSFALLLWRYHSWSKQCCLRSCWWNWPNPAPDLPYHPDTPILYTAPPDRRFLLHLFVRRFPLHCGSRWLFHSGVRQFHPRYNPVSYTHLIYSLSQKINPNWAILLNLKPEKTFQIPNLLILRQVR